MNYYKLNYTSNPLIVGKNFSQVFQFTTKVDSEALDSVYNFDSEGMRVKITPNLSNLKMAGSSKMTNFVNHIMGPSAVDLLFDIRVLNILKGKNIKRSPSQIFKAKVFHKNIEYDFFWYHPLFKLDGFINFEKSIFYNPVEEYNEFLKKIIDVNSYRAYIKKYVGGIRFQAKKLVLKNFDFDIFTIGKCNISTYISEKLLNEFLKNSITGMDFECSKDELEVCNSAG